MNECCLISVLGTLVAQNDWLLGGRLLVKNESNAFFRCFSTGPERLLQESRRSHLHQRPQDQGWGRVSLTNCKFSSTLACASNMFVCFWYLGGEKNLLFSVWWSSPTRNRWSTLLTRWTGRNWEEGKSRSLRRNRQALEAEEVDPGPGRQGGNKRWKWILLSRTMKNCTKS